MHITFMLLKDAVYACWGAIQPMLIDLLDAWVAWSREAATGAGGHHIIVKTLALRYLLPWTL